MKRPSGEARKSDDTACKAETGRDRKAWFAAIDKSGASRRAAIGKFLQGEKVDPWWITTLLVDHEAARGIVEKDGRPKGYSICSTKSVSANASRTYQALTTSRELAAWFGAGATIDTKEGGEIRDRDGVRGQIRKLRPGKAIAFTWDNAEFGGGSQVEILVQAKGDKTGLVVNHTRIESRRDADDLRHAWELALNSLKDHFEK